MEAFPVPASDLRGVHSSSRYAGLEPNLCVWIKTRISPAQEKLNISAIKKKARLICCLNSDYLELEMKSRVEILLLILVGRLEAVRGPKRICAYDELHGVLVSLALS